MLNPSYLTISEINDLLVRKELTSLEITNAYLDKIRKENSILNCLIDVLYERAEKDAKSADKLIQSGKYDSSNKLIGIPIAIKDLFCVNGTRTTAGSRILSNFVSPYDSTVTSRLEECGAVFIGKTNMDEFAMGSANVYSYYGPVTNPWSPRNSQGEIEDRYVPGGSSGGSAASVAAGMCVAALGTDTGGSVREPAAFCGVVGIKPTYGRCSRYGIVAFCSSLDQAGVLTHSVEDAAILLEKICGYDPNDATTSNIPVPPFRKEIVKDVKGLKIGIPREYLDGQMTSDVMTLWRSSMDILRDAGATIVEVSLPNAKYSIHTYYVIVCTEASTNLARYDGVRYGLRAEGCSDTREMMVKTRTMGFGEEVQRRIMVGTHITSRENNQKHYIKAQKVRQMIANDFTTAFETVDAILAPTTVDSAFLIGGKEDPIAMYMNDILTAPVNLAGLPAISIPVGLTKNVNMPVGMQVIGKPFDESMILRIGAFLEEVIGFRGFAKEKLIGMKR